MGHQALAVEVAAKHQHDEQDELQERIHDAMRGNGPVPEGVGHSVHCGREGSIQISSPRISRAGLPTRRNRTTACRRT